MPYGMTQDYINQQWLNDARNRQALTQKYGNYDVWNRIQAGSLQNPGGTNRAQAGLLLENLDTSPLYARHGQPITPANPDAALLPAVATSNEVGKRVLGQYDFGNTANLYGQSPYQGGLLQTLKALHQSMGQRPADLGVYGGSPQARGLAQTDISNQGIAAQTGLAMQEPGRIQGLLGLLLDNYLQGGRIWAERMQSNAAARQLKTQGRARKAELYSQVPIVGHLLAGGA